MAEFQDVIHMFSQYCSHIIDTKTPCNQCHFHYLRSEDHAGCVNHLVHYPAESEAFLLDMEGRQTKKKPWFCNFIYRHKSKKNSPDIHSTYLSSTQKCDISPNDRAICSLCGKTLDEFDIQEQFGFDYHIGYGSKYDLEHVKARFCCECFDGLLDELEAKCVHSPFMNEHNSYTYPENKEAVSSSSE